jgi:hypothetical protein
MCKIKEKQLLGAQLRESRPSPWNVNNLAVEVRRLMSDLLEDPELKALESQLQEEK